LNAFLGIYREPACSPGRHLRNDAAILELVASELERRGHRVALADVDAAARAGRDATVVFSMSRSPACLELQGRWTGEGKVVVNRPDAVIETARARLALRTFTSVRLPPTRLVPTSRALRDSIGGFSPEGRWVKGGDLYASRREDVHRVDSAAAFERVLDDFDRRGISTAVLQDHVDGREIKFYAVGSSGFFHSLDTGHTGGNPLGAGDAGEQDRAVDDVRRRAAEAGAAVALEIFGGDIVLCRDGSIVLIDLNDWPSFAPCLENGAAAIAAYLESRLVDRYAGALPARSAAPSPSA
jgi:hypothetical protein